MSRTDAETSAVEPDLQPLLADYGLFCQVYVDADAVTIVWPTGADWAPDEL